MDKMKQKIKSQNAGNPPMPEKYLYYIIIIYAIVSFLRIIGIWSNYLDFLAPGNAYEPFIHDLGNLLYIATTVFVIPTILLLIFIQIKGVKFSIILVPLLYVFLPLLVIILAFISLSVFGVPLYNSELSNTFIFRILNNNYFITIYYLGIVFYSIIVKQRLSNKGIVTCITIFSLFLFIGTSGASPSPILLKINGNEQTGGYYSSCWKEENETYSLCGDSFSINTAPEPLLTRSPFTAYLRLPLQELPDALVLNTAKVTEKNKLGKGKGTSNTYQAWNIAEWKRHNVSLGPESNINLSLPPGLYVFGVFALWDRKGSISYDFLVQVYEPGSDNANDPPTPALLKINGNEQTSGIGSYCWNAGNETNSLCTDTNATITPGEPLLTISPFTAHLRLPIEETPQELGFSTAKVTSKKERYGAQNDFYRTWSFDSNEWNWHNLPPGNESHINLPLPPGLYVLDVNAKWKDKGSVSYGFLVQVYEPEAKNANNAGPIEKTGGFEGFLAVTALLLLVIIRKNEPG